MRSPTSFSLLCGGSQSGWSGLGYSLFRGGFSWSQPPFPCTQRDPISKVMSPRARLILWSDGIAGGLVGALMLVLRAWLVDFYGLTPALITLIATANLAYASYSLSLAALSSLNRRPPRPAIDLLVTANAAWGLVCLGLIALHANQAGALGLLHIALEGVFVTWLAVIEYRQVRPEAR